MEASDGEKETPNPFSFEHFVKRHSSAEGQGFQDERCRNSISSSDENEDFQSSPVDSDSDSNSDVEKQNPFSFKNFMKKDSASSLNICENHTDKLTESQNRQQPPPQQPPVLPEKESSKGLHGSNGGKKQHTPQQQAEIIDFLYDVPPTRKVEDCGESQRSNKSNTAGRKGEIDVGCEDYMIPKGQHHQDYAVPRTTRATSHSHGSGSKGHKSDKHGSRARSNTAREDRKVNRKSKANTHQDKHQNDKHSDNDNGADYDEGDIHVSIEDILSETGGSGPHDVRRKTFTGIRPSDQKSNHKENGGVSSEMQRLKHENTKLKKELQESKRHGEKDSKKMREMESEIRRLKQREAEDAKALETMVQHVEDNLRRTTDRAVGAESHVAKLKQEIKHLKSHIHQMNSESKPTPPPTEEENNDLGAIRLKAQATSLKLASLSRDAEQQLKQLLSGVEVLKVVAETLACIDKVVEDNDSRHSTAL